MRSSTSNSFDIDYPFSLPDARVGVFSLTRSRMREESVLCSTSISSGVN